MRRTALAALALATLALPTVFATPALAETAPEVSYSGTYSGARSTVANASTSRTPFFAYEPSLGFTLADLGSGSATITTTITENAQAADWGLSGSGNLNAVGFMRVVPGESSVTPSTVFAAAHDGDPAAWFQDKHLRRLVLLRVRPLLQERRLGPGTRDLRPARTTMPPARRSTRRRRRSASSSRSTPPATTPGPSRRSTAPATPSRRTARVARPRSRATSTSPRTRRSSPSCASVPDTTPVTGSTRSA